MISQNSSLNKASQLMQKPFHKIEIYDAFIIKERNKPQQIRAV
jgi:hypothetical protein